MQSPETSTCPSPAVVSILFDVTKLDRTLAFYRDTLGFRHVSTDRKGLPFETWTLECDAYPMVALCARLTYRRPVVGSQPGGLVAIGLRTPSVRQALESLKGRVTFLTQVPETGPVTRAQFLDPDGYVIEIFE
ncbi:MAG: VOC family protein [Phycisphaerales bacterium]